MYTVVGGVGIAQARHGEAVKIISILIDPLLRWGDRYFRFRFFRHGVKVLPGIGGVNSSIRLVVR